jgi:nucleoside-diphosphate-sugar epimerase
LKRATIFRPHNVYGPDMGEQHVIPQFILRMAALIGRAGRPTEVIDFPIEGTGAETRAFVYISDLVDGVVRVLEHGEHLGIYHIGTDVETSVSNLAQAVARCFGRKIRVIAGELRPGGPLRRCPEITRMRALGYQPRVTLEEGLAMTVEWYRRNLAEKRADALENPGSRGRPVRA